MTNIINSGHKFVNKYRIAIQKNPDVKGKSEFRSINLVDDENIFDIDNLDIMLRDTIKQYINETTRK